MRTLYEDRYYRLDVDDHGVMKLIRSAEPITDMEDFVATMALIKGTVDRELAPSGRGSGLLIDTRKARARNDPDFELRTAEYRQTIRDAFDRSAVLVASAVGALQISRLARESGVQTATFTDEAEALAWLRGD